MRLEIDWTRCDRHGLCAELLPQRITTDEWGFPFVPPDDVSTDDLPAARRAVRSCPAIALRLESR
jgi:ferredoxin